MQGLFLRHHEVWCEAQMRLVFVPVMRKHKVSCPDIQVVGPLVRRMLLWWTAGATGSPALRPAEQPAVTTSSAQRGCTAGMQGAAMMAPASKLGGEDYEMLQTSCICTTYHQHVTACSHVSCKACAAIQTRHASCYGCHSIPP